MAHTAVVTGATGYVASELVKQLLEKGYNVRATVRSVVDATKVQHLRQLGTALPGKLELFEADLLSDGSFDKAVEGADVVFHTASPFKIVVEDPQRDLVEPAVFGTRNVISSAIKFKQTVQRVVLTSSVAAVHGNQNKALPQAGTLYSEADYNSTSTVEGGEGYWVSKTEAEKAAWALAKEGGIDLVTILPNFVLGPMLSERVDGLSVQFIQGWLEGKGSTGTLTICDVRDVARAHVLAAETPSAAGRYIVSNSAEISANYVASVLKERFPSFAIPEPEDAPTAEKINNNKATRELGLHITPVKSTLIDMATTAIQLGIAKPHKLTQ